FREEFWGRRTGRCGTGRRPTKDGAGNLSDRLGIDPALLQDLARQLFGTFSDRLVFDRGRCGGFWRVGPLSDVLVLCRCYLNVADFAQGRQEDGSRTIQFRVAAGTQFAEQTVAWAAAASSSPESASPRTRKMPRPLGHGLR